MEELALANGIEEDTHRVAQRQKQIDYGKNTIAYDRFVAMRPREQRVRGDPMTPIAKQKCSKRSFAGQVTSWKKKVYDFVAKLDSAGAEEEDKIGKTANGVANEDKHHGTQTESKCVANMEASPEDVVMKDASTVDAVDWGAVDWAQEDFEISQDTVDLPSDTLSNKNSAASDKSKTVMASDEDEEDFSDLDDIELDDQGNVVPSNTTTPSNLKEQAHKHGVLESSPPSIFDIY